VLLLVLVRYALFHCALRQLASLQMPNGIATPLHNVILEAILDTVLTPTPIAPLCRPRLRLGKGLSPGYSPTSINPFYPLIANR
jgi:hypothetical protein